MVVWTNLCAGVTGNPVVQMCSGNADTGMLAWQEGEMEVKVTFCPLVFPRLFKYESSGKLESKFVRSEKAGIIVIKIILSRFALVLLQKK